MVLWGLLELCLGGSGGGLRCVYSFMLESLLQSGEKYTPPPDSYSRSLDRCAAPSMFATDPCHGLPWSNASECVFVTKAYSFVSAAMP